MRRIILAILTAAITVNSYAASEVKDAAGLAFSFMNIGAGARAAGMGEAFTAVSDDVSAIYWNPAGLGKIRAPEISLTYYSMYVDSSYQYLMGAFPAGPGTAGIDVSYVYFGNFDLRDDAGVLLGEKASPYNIGVTAAYGMEFSKLLSAGAAVKYLSQAAAGTSLSGFTFDAGLLADFGILSAGLNARNIGAAGSYSVPTDIRAGLAGKIEMPPEHRLIIAGDIGYAVKGSMKYSVGAEYTFNNILSLRAGYRIKDENTDLGGMAGLFAGAGAALSGMKIDYSISPYGDLGITHNITFGYRFGDDAGNKNTEKETVTAAGADAEITANLIGMAKEAMKAGKYEKAIGYFKEALGYSRSAATYRKIGECYYRIKDRQKAMRYYSLSLELEDEPELRKWVENQKKLK